MSIRPDVAQIMGQVYNLYLLIDRTVENCGPHNEGNFPALLKFA